jgi:hypothetical protein
MTERGVERTLRTAHRPSPVPPAGISALMPPSSQGAERRTERHATRTGPRWGLRVLVIGGLAGAAWLLSGAAAHAADRDPAPEGSLLGTSLVGSVLPGGEAHQVVTRVLKAAAQPLESNHHAHDQRELGSIRRVQYLMQAPTVIVGNLTEAADGKTDADSAVGGAVRVVRDLTAPLRLPGGPADSRQLDPVSAPVTKVLRPAVDLLPHAARPAPVSQHHQQTPVPQQHQMTPAAVGSTAAHQQEPSGTGISVRDEAVTGAVASPGREVGDRDTAGMTGTVSQWRPGAADRHYAAARADEPETVQETPGGDGPAPLQAHLGAVSGIPTSGSGAPTEGGSAAFLPVAVGENAVASHRLARATDVEARHHDAEEPTVSPD